MRRPIAQVYRKEELDRFRCDVPGCDACVANEHRIYFRARCHPRARLFACYQKATVAVDGDEPREVGMVVLECPGCRREVARILVGP